MPAFVIHQLGQQPRIVSFESSPVRVGREASCDVVLGEETVSREHAVFLKDEAGAWHVTCVSDTNPIVVDGALVTTAVPAVEGTEILVGSAHLIVYSQDEATARAYLGAKTYFAKSKCVKCLWLGVVSTLRRQPVCPRCGGTELTAVGSRSSVAAHGASTSKMSPAEAKAFWSKLKAAKRSVLERIDGRDPSDARRELAEDKALSIGTSEASALRLAGLTFGSVRVAWDGTAFVATSAMKFPAMKVNGVKASTAALASGDVLEIGSNRFRFVTE